MAALVLLLLGHYQMISFSGAADLFRCLDAEGLDSLSMAQKRLPGFQSDRFKDAYRL